MSRRRERGQALAELALVVPILALAVMGTVDVGRLLFAAVAVEEGAQEGALYYAYNPTASQDAIRDRVRASSNAPEVSGAAVTTSGCSTTTLTVTAEFDYPLVTPLISELLGTTVHLGSTVTTTNLLGAC